MNKKELLAKYKAFPTYSIIAKEAFDVGFKLGKEKNQTLEAKKNEIELKKVTKELNNLWKTLEDPEKCGELLSGM